MIVDIAGSRTIADLVDSGAGAHPDRECMTVEDADGKISELSYRDLRDRTLALAGGFAARGVQKGDRVLVQLPNSAELVLSWFALARLGAIMVPSNTANVAREIAHIVTHAGVTFAVVGAIALNEVRSATRDRLRAGQIAVVGGEADGTIPFAELVDASPLLDRVRVDSDDLAELIFTSGTTALPKAVMITHANCVRSGEQVAKSLYLEPMDRCLSALPAFHVNAQSSTILPALVVGASFALMHAYSASAYLRQLVRHRATVTSLVAMQVRTLLRQPPSAADRAHRVRRVFYAINVTTPEKDAFEERFGMPLLNGYGLSEAMTAVTIAPLYGERRWPSQGLPLIDREVRIVDANGRPVAYGTTGEITVRGRPGRGIMKGYWNDPDATTNALRGNWLFTGDFGYVDEDGYLYFVDRKIDLIKRAGENVSASEVESVLLEHPGVAQAAVIGVPDEIRDEAVKAFVVVRDGATCGSAELIDHCRGRLAPFKVPSEVDVVASLPMTSVGKIEKKALRAMVTAR